MLKKRKQAILSTIESELLDTSQNPLNQNFQDLPDEFTISVRNIMNSKYFPKEMFRGGRSSVWRGLESLCDEGYLKHKYQAAGEYEIDGSTLPIPKNQWDWAIDLQMKRNFVAIVKGLKDNGQEFPGDTLNMYENYKFQLDWDLKIRREECKQAKDGTLHKPYREDYANDKAFNRAQKRYRAYAKDPGPKKYKEYWPPH